MSDDWDFARDEPKEEDAWALAVYDEQDNLPRSPHFAVDDIRKADWAVALSGSNRDTARPAARPGLARDVGESDCGQPDG